MKNPDNVNVREAFAYIREQASTLPFLKTVMISTMSQPEYSFDERDYLYRQKIGPQIDFRFSQKDMLRYVQLGAVYSLANKVAASESHYGKLQINPMINIHDDVIGLIGICTAKDQKYSAELKRASSSDLEYRFRKYWEEFAVALASYIGKVRIPINELKESDKPSKYIYEFTRIFSASDIEAIKRLFLPGSEFPVTALDWTAKYVKGSSARLGRLNEELSTLILVPGI